MFSGRLSLFILLHREDNFSLVIFDVECLVSGHIAVAAMDVLKMPPTNTEVLGPLVTLAFCAL